MPEQRSLQSLPVVAIVGPTAIGKTALSLELAREFNCEIISVDSMQVYKYMDIGTAKIRPEEMGGIPHHLIDVVLPDEDYDAARFVQDCSREIQEISGRGRLPLLAGGTGLYLKALTEGLFEEIPSSEDIRTILKQRLVSEGSSKLHEELEVCDPASARRIHPNDTNRIIRGLEIFLASGVPWSEHLLRQNLDGRKGAIGNILQIGLTCDRQLLYERINLRSRLMVEGGLKGEVLQLFDMGFHKNLQPMQSIGYKHMVNYLNKTWSFDEMLEFLRRDTRRYAKRQYTWFNGIRGIEWFDVKDVRGIVERIAAWLSTRQHPAE